MSKALRPAVRHGTELHGLRLAGSLAKRDGEQVKVFLTELTTWTQWADRVLVF